MQLGKKTILTPEQIETPESILETFPNPQQGRRFQIEMVFPEFTSVCPVTSQPDFATITVRYIPDKVCVEMKSLKLYYFAFRNKGIFYEAITNMILDHLVAAVQPLHMVVEGKFNARGGTFGTITAEYSRP